MVTVGTCNCLSLGSTSSLIALSFVLACGDGSVGTQSKDDAGVAKDASESEIADAGPNYDARIPPEADGDWTRRSGSLSVDLHGWTNNPDIAANSDGSAVYAAWTQHVNPANWEQSGIRVAKWESGFWTDLGGRIGHSLNEATWPSAYDPSLAVVGGVPYIAWYEGGGYGFATDHGAAVFVSHWNGDAWVADGQASNTFGALNSQPAISARNPRLANVAGVLYAAWIEHLPDNRNVDQVMVARLTQGSWSHIDTIAAGTNDGGAHKVIDLAMSAVSGQLYVGWTEFDRVTVDSTLTIPRSLVHVARLENDSLAMVGGALNVAPDGRANYLDMAESNGTLYVAWQEKSPTGNYRNFVSHWNGSQWTNDGGALNLDVDSGEAGRPALAGDGGGVWLSWVEGGPKEPAQLRARHFDGATWSAISGSLNYSPADGSADSPAIHIVSGVPHVAWTEKHLPSATKQIYVTAADDLGDNAQDTLTQYGADGPPVSPPPNTWIKVNAGGITENSDGVGDEAYSSISYVSAIRRTVLFGKYHAVGSSSGEDQNALLAYDSTRNRWDVVEITENTWSEHLPGVGHDEGHVAVDSVEGLYITHGNLSLNGGTRYQTYIYDLIAGRGKRMLPAAAFSPNITVSTGAFDTKRRLAYVTPYRYDLAQNRWDLLTDCYTGRWSEGVAYDPVNDLMLQFGGQGFQSEPSAEVRSVNLDTLSCQTETLNTVPPPGMSHLTYNSKHKVIMAVVGGLNNAAATLQLWVFDGTTRVWTPLGDVPPDFPTTLSSGQFLTYDSDNDLLLLHNGTYLDSLRAYRYVP